MKARDTSIQKVASAGAKALDTRASESKQSEDLESDNILLRIKRAREIVSGIATAHIPSPVKKIRIENYDIYYKNKARKQYTSHEDLPQKSIPEDKILRNEQESKVEVSSILSQKLNEDNTPKASLQIKPKNSESLFPTNSLTQTNPKPLQQMFSHPVQSDSRVILPSIVDPMQKSNDNQKLDANPQKGPNDKQLFSFQPLENINYSFKQMTESSGNPFASEKQLFPFSTSLRQTKNTSDFSDMGEKKLFSFTTSVKPNENPENPSGSSEKKTFPFASSLPNVDLSTNSTSFMNNSPFGGSSLFENKPASWPPAPNSLTIPISNQETKGPNEASPSKSIVDKPILSQADNPPKPSSLFSNSLLNTGIPSNPAPLTGSLFSDPSRSPAGLFSNLAPNPGLISDTTAATKPLSNISPSTGLFSTSTPSTTISSSPIPATGLFSTSASSTGLFSGVAPNPPQNSLFGSGPFPTTAMPSQNSLFSNANLAPKSSLFSPQTTSDPSPNPTSMFAKPSVGNPNSASLFGPSLLPSNQSGGLFQGSTLKAGSTIATNPPPTAQKPLNPFFVSTPVPAEFFEEEGFAPDSGGSGDDDS